MPDPIARLNAALKGRYAIERELGEGGMANVYLREHPLAHGKRRQDVIDEMGSGPDHAAWVTGRTHAAALATERYQKVVATAGAAGASEAVRQNATTQVGAEVTLDP